MITESDVECDNPRFKIECIEKSVPPKGISGGNWYRYVIGQDGSKITGFKKGTLQSVTDHLEIFTENLNERSASGVSPNAHTARGRK
jgi:hypothetical protein